MKPIEFKEQTTEYGKGQPDYIPLPAHQYNDAEGRIAVCWKLNWKERLKILISGQVWQQVLTFNKPLQPQKLEAVKPEMGA